MRVQLPQVLDGEWVDAHLGDWTARKDEPLVIDAAQWARARIFAEGRLLGALATVRDIGRPVEVRIGPNLPRVTDDPRHHRWKFLRDEAAAVILVNAACSVRTESEAAGRREEIAAVQHAVLHATGEVATGSACALVAIDDFNGPAPMSAFEQSHDDYTLLDERLADMAKTVGLSGDRQLPQLAGFAREAVENTREHAKRLHTEPRLLRLLVLRRISVTPQQVLQEVLPSGAGPVQRFLDRLTVLAPPEQGSALLAELTVADAGPGVAAHLLGDPGVYSGPFDEEARACVRATLPGVSSKATSVTGRGSGLANAMSAAVERHGLVVIRSGRTELVFDATAPDGPVDGWHVARRARVVGTCISLLLPWWNTDQERLSTG